MTNQSTFAEVPAMLEATDGDLRCLSVDRLEELCQDQEELLDERLWPSSLRRLFVEADSASKRSLHGIVETHYGSLMRRASGEEFWKLSALAYARVIPLRLGYDESMGHKSADTFFVVRSAQEAFPNCNVDSLRILDVGCGTGELLAELASLGFSALEGIDISKAAISSASRRLHGSTAMLRCMSLRRLLQEGPSSTYNVITLKDVIEHLPRSDVPEILRGLRRLLLPGGLLVVVTPSAITGPHDFDFLPKGCATDGLHLHEYRLRELRTTLRDAGFGCLRSSFFTPSEYRSARPGRSAFLLKLTVERLLDYLPSALAVHLTEMLYFRGIACYRTP